MDIFRYYARESSLRVAERFFAQVEATFARLAAMPGMGTHYDLEQPAIAELRFFPSLASACTWSSTGLSTGASRLSVFCTAHDVAGVLTEEFGIVAGSTRNAEEPNES